MKRSIQLLLIFALVWLTYPAFAGEARLLREPTVSTDHIAFVYANDIWIVPPKEYPILQVDSQLSKGSS